MAVSLFSSSPSNKITAVKLPCPVSDQVKPFGEQILYYDGLKIHCMSEGGTVNWSFQIGSNGGYHCNNQNIVAWSGPNLYIINKSGSPTYNDNLGSQVQFARVGESYVAAVVGDSISPRLLVKDLTGAHMDEESEAYSSMILLDAGFFGSSGQYMWSLALDVYSTASNTILNTFEVGKMNTGETSLGEYITYKVLYDNNVLRTINTRKIRTFSERGVENTSESTLVYGWKFLDYEHPSRGYAYMLFAPSEQTGASYSIQELRLLQGTNLDKRYSLSDSCIGALIYQKAVYAVSGKQLYRIGLNESRFSTWNLPIQDEVQDYLGKLDSGCVLLSTADAVYCVKLPQMKK